jgi:hypothetical protein
LSIVGLAVNPPSEIQPGAQKCRRGWMQAMIGVVIPLFPRPRAPSCLVLTPKLHGPIPTSLRLRLAASGREQQEYLGRFRETVRRITGKSTALAGRHPAVRVLSSSFLLGGHPNGHIANAELPGEDPSTPATRRHEST